MDSERLSILEDRLYRVEQKVGVAFVKAVEEGIEYEKDEECECGMLMSAHSGGFALLHHDDVVIKNFLQNLIKQHYFHPQEARTR